MKKQFHKYMQFLGISNLGIQRIFIVSLSIGCIIWVNFIFEHEENVKLRQKLIDEYRNEVKSEYGDFSKDDFVFPISSDDSLSFRKKLYKIIDMKEVKEKRDGNMSANLYIGVPILFVILSIFIKISTWIFEGFVKNKEMNK
jgi:hypothetical protein